MTSPAFPNWKPFFSAHHEQFRADHWSVVNCYFKAIPYRSTVVQGETEVPRQNIEKFGRVNIGTLISPTKQKYEQEIAEIVPRWRRRVSSLTTMPPLSTFFFNNLQEGRQASLAADFSITQFKYLGRLLVWHGRNRFVKMMLKSKMLWEK